MKKTNFIMALIVTTSFAAFAQSVPLHTVATFNTPKNATKVEKEAVRSNAKYPSFDTKGTGDYYKIGSGVVRLSAFKHATTEQYLPTQKKEQDGLFSLNRPPVYSSTIKKVKNYNALIVHYEFPDDRVGNYMFIVVNPSKTAIIRGIFEYPKSDRTSAEQALNDFLKEINFK